MNAHERYVANLVAGLTPAQVARLVAEPPSGRSQRLGVTEVHALVVTHGGRDTKAAWVGLLADAADPKHADGKWEPGWAGPIARLIFDLPVDGVDELGDGDDGAQLGVAA